MSVRITLVLLIAVAAMGRTNAIASEDLPKRTFSCGDVVNRSARLANDVGTPVSPCVVNGLRVAPGVTLDLNGRTIWGNGTDNDPAIEAGLRLGSEAVAKNGTVRGFERGVFVLFNLASRIADIVAADNGIGVSMSGSGHRVSGVVAVHNAGDGIIVTSDRSTVSRSVAVRNIGDGIDVTGNNATVDRNVASNNGRGLTIDGNGIDVLANVAGANNGTGIHVSGDSPLVERNAAVGNDADGIWLDTTSHGIVRKNRVIDNGNEGIQVNGVDTTVANNRVSANSQDGIDSGGDRNAFRGNHTEGNVGSGIEVGGTAQRIVNNKVVGNGDSGIRFASGGGNLVDNRIVANGFPSGATDGMDPGLDATAATSGVTGSGNISRANDGVGCIPAVCEVRDTGFPGFNLSCGATVFGEIRLASDVGSAGSPCEGHGLVVLSQDTTIDLDGHTIWGNETDDVADTEAGIRMHGDPDVRVLDGRIRGFEMGVVSTGDSRKTTIDGLVISGSDGPGIQLDGRGAKVVDSAVVSNAIGVPLPSVASGILISDPPATISGNVVAGNGQDGIRGDLGGSLITGNVIASNDIEGIFAGGLSENTRVVKNVVMTNAETGIEVTTDDSAIKQNVVVRNGAALGAFSAIRADAPRMNVAGNVTSDNDGQGITLLGHRSTLQGNLSVLDGSGIISAIAIGTSASGSDVSKNVVLASADDGFLVNGRVSFVKNAMYDSGDAGVQVGASNVKIRNNRFIGSDLDGLLLMASVDGATVVANRAVGNGFGFVNETGLGINAAAAANVSGDNIAYGNDDPDDCDPGSLC